MEYIARLQVLGIFRYELMMWSEGEAPRPFIRVPVYRPLDLCGVPEAGAVPADPGAYALEFVRAYDEGVRTENGLPVVCYRLRAVDSFVRALEEWARAVVRPWVGRPSEVAQECDDATPNLFGGVQMPRPQGTPIPPPAAPPDEVCEGRPPDRDDDLAVPPGAEDLDGMTFADIDAWLTANGYGEAAAPAADPPADD